MARARKTLAEATPAVAREWHPTKNGELTPRDVAKTSPEKVWWKGGSCGHEWPATVQSRVRGSRCPFCTPGVRKPLIVGFNDLASQNPVVASEWHPTKNGNLTPEQVSVQSGKKAWWLGKKCGHEWQAIVSNRYKGASCPYCAGKRILSGYNDFATLEPELASEWDYERNGDLDPTQLARSSRKVVWWIGRDCGHSWTAQVDQRSQGSGCIYCSGRSVLKGVNDLEALAPETAADWDYERNGGTKPSEVRMQSNQQFWWRGAKCGHRWKTTPAHRARGQNCPYCSGRRVLAGFNDLATLKPEIAASWHPTKNGERTPKDVTVSTGSKAWWICEFGHEWQSIIASRSNGVGCPACDGKLTVPGETDLFTVRPDVAEEWDYEKNRDLRPENINPYSGKKAWWLGKECGHSWQSAIAFRSGVSLKCPICLGRRVLEGFNDLATRFPEIAAQWDPDLNGELGPMQVTAGSNKTIWWKCEKGHQWQSTPATRTSGIGCPFCGGFYVIPGENDLQTLRPEIAAEWDEEKNGELTPRDVKTGSNSKVWWLCDKGHSWRTAVAERIYHETGCPICFEPWSKAEKQLYAYVVATFPELEVHENYRTQNLGLFELDIYVEDVRLGIEFNGEYWHDESRDPQIKDRHERKQAICDTYEVRLAIVWEKDWNERQNEVKEQIAALVAGDEIPAWMTYTRE